MQDEESQQTLDTVMAFMGNFETTLWEKVRDGQVVLWNWLENSYAISKAFT